MPTLVIEEPNEKQIEFLSARERYVGFGGARGGGKSWAVRTKAKLGALRYPGIKIMIVRQSYPELRENHIIPLCRELKTGHPDKKKRLASYNDSKKTITFPNGSRILFQYLERDADTSRLQGTEVDWLFIDEATHQSEERFERLKACVRGTGDYPRRVFCTMNPGGVGHAWVKRLFIDRQYKESENPADYRFIQSLVTDNKTLMEKDPEYIKQLESLPPKLRDAWLYGNWDIFSGQVFEDFIQNPSPEHCAEENATAEELRSQHRWCHVIEPFDIPSWWTIGRSYDFGYAKPFSCDWYAYDGETIYMIMQLYGCTETPNEGLKWTPDEQARKIAEVEQSHPLLKGKKITGIADPAIWDKSRGESIQETFARHGVYFQPGNHNRIQGLMQCHYRLQFDENGYSRFYVFSNCRHFIRTIPLLMYDEHNPEDIDTSQEDHIYDSWRYFMMNYPVKPQAPVERKVILSDPLNMFARSK